MKITDKHGQQWKLVPVEPNMKMIDAAIPQDDYERRDYAESYEAMLSAAPEPELPEGLEPVAWLSAGGDVSRSKKYFDEMGFESDPLVLQSAALAALAKRDAEIAQGIEGPQHYRQNNVKLRQELAEISAALDDPRSDLTMTMPEIIKDLRDRVQHQAALIEKFHFAIESMRVAGGHVEFQAAFDRAKELLHSNEIVTAIDILGHHT